MVRPPPPPAPRGSRPGCRPAGEGGTWQRAPCRLGGVAITSTPSTCLLPGLGWEVGEDSRSWAPGPLGSSVPAPASGRRQREDRLLWEQAAESHWRVQGPVCPREHVAAPVKPRDGISGRRGVGRGLGPPHPPTPVMAGQALGRSPMLDCTRARVVGCFRTLGHHVPTQAKGDRSTGEAVLGHRPASPNEAHALLGAGRARSCPERGQRPVPGCRAVPERSRGRQEPEATRATMATRPRGGCEP